MSVQPKNTVGELETRLQALEIDPDSATIRQIFERNSANPERAFQDLMKFIANTPDEKTSALEERIMNILKSLPSSYGLKVQACWVKLIAQNARSTQFELLATECDKFAVKLEDSSIFSTLSPVQATELNRECAMLFKMCDTLPAVMQHAQGQITPDDRRSTLPEVVNIFSQNPFTPEQAVAQLIKLCRKSSNALQLAMLIVNNLLPNYRVRCLIAITQHNILAGKTQHLDERVAWAEQRLAKLQACTADPLLTHEQINMIVGEIKQGDKQWKDNEAAAKTLHDRDIKEIIGLCRQDVDKAIMKLSQVGVENRARGQQGVAQTVRDEVRKWVATQPLQFQAVFNASNIRSIALAPSLAGTPIHTILIRFAERFTALSQEKPLTAGKYDLLNEDNAEFSYITQEIGAFHQFTISRVRDAQAKPTGVPLERLITLESDFSNQHERCTLKLCSLWSRFRSEGRLEDATSMTEVCDYYLPPLKFRIPEGDEELELDTDLSTSDWLSKIKLLGSKTFPRRHLRIAIDSKEQKSAVWVESHAGTQTQWIQSAWCKEDAWKLCTVDKVFPRGRIMSPPALLVDRQDNVHLVWLQSHQEASSKTWTAPRVYTATFKDGKSSGTTVISDYGCSSLKLLRDVGGKVVAEWTNSEGVVERKPL